MPALIEFCQNEQRVREASRCNYQKIQNEYSMERMHERLAEYYEAVVQS